MLDKSVEYTDVFMRRPKCFPITEYPLPDGLRYVYYKTGDARAWAQIETSVLEFNTPDDALAHLNKFYMRFEDELKNRLIFVENESGRKIATAMPWWGVLGGKRDPWLNWIAVTPDFQGGGIGKAIASHALAISQAIDGKSDIFLKTQTWSHRAINMYQKLGFVLYAKDLPGVDNSQAEKAAEILRRLGYNIIVEN